MLATHPHLGVFIRLALCTSVESRWNCRPRSCLGSDCCHMLRSLCSHVELAPRTPRSLLGALAMTCVITVHAGWKRGYDLLTQYDEPRTSSSEGPAIEQILFVDALEVAEAGRYRPLSVPIMSWLVAVGSKCSRILVHLHRILTCSIHMERDVLKSVGMRSLH